MWACVLLLMTGQAVGASVDELVVAPDTPVAATVAGQPARLRVESGLVDRLTLDPAFVAKHAIKPAAIAGRAEMEVAGRREFKGRNRSLPLVIGGRSKEGRAYWFDATTIGGGLDGSVGPFGLPHNRVTFTLAPARAGETATRLPLYGDADTSGFTAGRIDGRSVAFSFEPGSREAYPIASAAAGAHLARIAGGTVSGPSWDVDVLMGVMRPVRLLTLAEPIDFGPIKLTQLAVRVPDRIDASGRGTLIAEAGELRDPAEVVVEGKAKGPGASYVITIPRAALSGCSRITFDKVAKMIKLACVSEK